MAASVKNSKAGLYFITGVFQPISGYRIECCFFRDCPCDWIFLTTINNIQGALEIYYQLFDETNQLQNGRQQMKHSYRISVYMLRKVFNKIN
jgi:hypothetical protein